MVKKNFWKNKRVLITGHTGFKGSWLSLWLKSLGVHLYGISLPLSSENFFFFKT
jgi:CDP-glucose 4,6-dehydratase